MHAEIYQIMNIDVPAGVSAPHLTHTTNLFCLKPEAVLYWAPLITARNDTSIYHTLQGSLFSIFKHDVHIQLQILSSITFTLFHYIYMVALQPTCVEDYTERP